MKTWQKILGWFWASCLTFPGALVWLILDAAPIRRRGSTWEWVCCPDGILEDWLIKGHFVAFTFGTLVVYRSGRFMVDPRVQAHEDRHVLQYMILGPLHPLVYAASSLWCLARGKDWYRDNVLERDAREHAAR